MRALVADDHPLYREAACCRLERLLPGLEIVEEGREPRDGNPGYAVLLARRNG